MYSLVAFPGCVRVLHLVLNKKIPKASKQASNQSIHSHSMWKMACEEKHVWEDPVSDYLCSQCTSCLLSLASAITWLLRTSSATNKSYQAMTHFRQNKEKVLFTQSEKN